MGASDKSVFSNLLQHSEQISRIDLFTSYPMRRVSHDVSESRHLLGAFRKIMERTHDDESKPAKFVDFWTYGAEFDEEVKSDYRCGLVAAIDGTDQLCPTTLAASTIYAVEVFGKTSQSASASICTLCATRTGSPSGSSTPDIYELARYLDEVRGADASSSFTTFREYQERMFAVKHLPDSVRTCLIDGPIFTQNLLTQTAGRACLDALVDSGRKYIGIVKNLSGSWALCRWAAHCLDRGEAYVIGRLSDQFIEDRARSAGGASAAVSEWLEHGKRKDYVRVVYRPKETAFAFECHLNDLPYAISLLRFDASDHVNHEMPRLMQLVDAEARRANTSSKAREKLVSEVARIDKRLANDLDDERRSR